MNRLAGLRVLVVEDSALLALMLRGMLEELGCAVAGVAGDIAEACAMARRLELDLAVLDRDIGGSPSDPVADILQQRSVHLVFASGHETDGLPERFGGAVQITKPFMPEDLRRAIERALQI